MKYRLPLILLTAVLLLCGMLWWLNASHLKSESQNHLTLASALASADTAGYERAVGVKAFHFPADHGPHLSFKTEWWYFTGNLHTRNGRHLGYQLTFFRNALAPRLKARTSAWATNQLYMAHFALSDAETGRFRSYEHFSRGAAGLAGATMDSNLKVWLEGWQLTGSKGNYHLNAATEDIGINLQADSLKPLTLEGDRGLSRKGPGIGNASYYYSETRLPTTGKIWVGRDTFTVTGNSWLDREWSTSALAPDQAGWDWFALQLNDGSELMYYNLRKKNGQSDSLSGGTIIAANGSSTRIYPQDIHFTVRASRTNPTSGTVYASAWELSLPKSNLNLTIKPLIPDQELAGPIRYWEGAVNISGSKAGKDVTGEGYVELTGYDQQAMP